MAIYVKGMEMPNSCDDCPINNDWRCALRINTPHQHNIDAGAWKYRMGWCPLVEVPVDEERRAMTREEAIRKLKRELEAIEGDWRFKEFAEALDMAIEALRNEINCVKCQYYTERETYTGIKGECKMDTAHREELISRSRAIKDISYWATNIIDPKMLVKEDALYILESLPSAEPKKETVLCALADRTCPFQGKEYAWCLTCPHISEEDRSLVKKAIEPRTGECKTCKRNVDNGGFYDDGRTRCPIQEHYALPNDGYCHLYEPRMRGDDK